MDIGEAPMGIGETEMRKAEPPIHKARRQCESATRQWPSPPLQWVSPTRKWQLPSLQCVSASPRPLKANIGPTALASRGTLAINGRRGRFFGVDTAHVVVAVAVDELGVWI